MKWGAMKAHLRRRLTLIALVLLAVGSTIGLTLRALNSNINLFYAPDQIVGGEAPINQRIRAGGMVAEGSLVREAKGLMGSENVKWNFTKFLVGPDGKVVRRYPPTTKPEDIRADIEKLLPA